MRISSRKKDILGIGERSTKRLDDTTIAEEAKYSIRSRKKCCLSLHYNGGSSFLFVNGVKK